MYAAHIFLPLAVALTDPLKLASYHPSYVLNPASRSERLTTVGS